MSDQFDLVAERTRQGLRSMTEALASEFDGTDRAETLGAMTTGAVCQAVEFYFGAVTLTNVPFVEARAELDRLVDTYWKQTLVRHIIAQAKKGKAPSR